MRRSALLALACCTLAPVFNPARADDPPPVEMGALARGFALPAVGRPEVLTPGALRQRVYLNDTNEYTARDNADESILLDGEATLLTYEVRYGLTDRWEAGAYVPLLSQGGGFLDSIIQGWHSAWGLPQGGRDEAPKNKYRYLYVRNGQTLLNVDQGSVTFGDLRLTTGYQILPNLAARAMLQLPTSDASHLSGSGAAGGAAWLDGAVPLSGWLHWLKLYGSMGYSYTGTGDIISGQQEHSLLFGAAGLGVQFTRRWDAKLQVYFHGAPYKDSGLAALDHVAAPLTVSTSYRVTPKTAVSLGFQEKANIFASPDFGVFLGVTLD